MIRSILLAALLAAPVSGASSRPAPRTHTVVIDKMKFGAMPSDARVGDAILWVNADVVRHTATARNGSFDADLAPEAKGVTRLRTAGEVKIICKFHPGMKAALYVGK